MTDNKMASDCFRFNIFPASVRRHALPAQLPATGAATRRLNAGRRRRRYR